MNSYKTIARTVEAVLHKERKSKFFTYAYPLNSEEEVKPIVEQLRKAYPTANHVCYAWQLGVEQPHFRANDDGEPNNSAGQPIYGQIQAYDLTNVGIFVVRVFGGTKLGVGGLITAYRTAAQLALEKAVIIQKELVKTIELQFDYKYLSFVMSVIKKINLNILNQKSDLKCTYLVEVPLKDEKIFLAQLDLHHQIEAIVID